MRTKLPITFPGQQLYGRDQFYSYILSLNDLQEISLIQSSNDDLRLYELLNTLLIDFDIYDLTENDVYYYIHWLRVQSYTFVPMTISWECPVCKEIKYDVLLDSDLIIDDIPKSYDKYITIKLFSGKDLKLRYLTVGDIVKSKAYVKSGKCLRQDVAQVLCMLEPNDLDLSERQELYNSLSADDFFLISEAEKMMNYGVRPYIIKKCCDKEVRVGFTLTLDRFLSDDNRRLSLRTRILFEEESNDTESSGGGSSEDVMDEKTIYSRDKRAKEKVPGEKRYKTVKDIVN